MEGTWFMSLDENDDIIITHYCKGVETDEEVREYHKKGIQGNLKPKGTNTKGTFWFNPAPEYMDENDNDCGYRCQACHLTADERTKFTQMGDNT